MCPNLEQAALASPLPSTSLDWHPEYPLVRGEVHRRSVPEQLQLPRQQQQSGWGQNVYF